MMSERGDGTARELAVRVAAEATSAGLGLVVAGSAGALAGSAMTPVVERAFLYLDGRFLQRRLRNAAETLSDAVGEYGVTTDEGFERFIELLVSDEHHEELLTRVLAVAQDTAMRDKRRALSRVLANGAGETGTKVDARFAEVRIIADLDPAHVRTLRIMGLTPPHLTSARQWYPWSLAEADPGLSDAVWIVLPALERHGLVSNHGEYHTPAGGFEPEYEITPYGDYFLGLLHDPSEDVVDGVSQPSAKS